MRSIHFLFAEFIISLFDQFKKQNAYLYISVNIYFFVTKQFPYSL